MTGGRLGEVWDALSGLIWRGRRRLESSPATRWLIGGDDSAVGHSLLQGLFGSLMIMVGSWGVGWMASTPTSWFARTTVLNPLRVEPVGVIACAVLLVLGSLVLVRAWLRVGQRLEGRWAQGRSTVVSAAWLWTVPLLFTFPVFSRDVYSYLAQGRLLHAGLNPYEDWISELPGWFMHGADSIWAESPSPYGPLFLLFAQFVWFVTGGSPEPAVILFRAIAVIGLALCLWAVPRLAERFGGCPAWATWVSVANPLFPLYMVAGVHNDSLMLGLLLCGFVLLRSTADPVRNLLGLLLVALSVAIKPLTLLALPFAGLLMHTGRARLGAPDGLPRPTPGLTDRIRSWALTAGVALAVLAAVGMVSGLWFGWIPAMATSGDAAFPYAPFGLLGLGVGWLVDLIAGTGIRPPADLVYTLGKAATAVLTAWLALTRRPINPVLATGLVLLAAVLLAPIIQPWYLLWVLPLVAVVRRWSGWPVWCLHLLVMLLVVIGVVDQLSVAQWIPLLWVRLVTAVAGALYLVYIVALDPKTSALFPFAGWAARRRSTPAPAVETQEH